MREFKVVIIGSKKGELPIASEIGRLAAAAGLTIVTGGGKGLPLEVARTCHDAGGTTIGISPALSETEHREKGWPVEEFSEIIYVGKDYPGKSWESRLKHRNVDLMETAVAVIVISGGWGTLTEFGINVSIGKPTIVLNTTGGFAMRIFQLESDLGMPNFPIIHIGEMYGIPEKVIKQLLEWKQKLEETAQESAPETPATETPQGEKVSGVLIYKGPVDEILSESRTPFIGTSGQTDKTPPEEEYDWLKSQRSGPPPGMSHEKWVKMQDEQSASCG